MDKNPTPSFEFDDEDRIDIVRTVARVMKSAAIVSLVLAILGVLTSFWTSVSIGVTTLLIWIIYHLYIGYSARIPAIYKVATMIVVGILMLLGLGIGAAWVFLNYGYWATFIAALLTAVICFATMCCTRRT